MDLFGNRRIPNPPPGKGFNSYAAGKKHYGAGRSMPNIGPVRHMLGYRERDNKAKARKSAILRRMESQRSGNFMSPSILSGNSGGVY